MAREPFTGVTREDLIAVITAQAHQIETLGAQVKQLLEQSRALRDDIRDLRRRQGKPPSTPFSQRPPWDKPKPKRDSKPPGQKKGHKGVTRQRPERPDKAIDHPECNCPDCGACLVNIGFLFSLLPRHRVRFQRYTAAARIYTSGHSETHAHRCPPLCALCDLCG